MKKFLAIIVLAGVFTACGNGTETETTDSTMMETPMMDTTTMMGDTTMMMMDTTTMMK